jgi:cytoskeletal protein RodZ
VTDDPSDRPTRMANYGHEGSVPVLDEVPEPLAEPPEAEVESAPQPWYRNRVLLGLWALLVAILIGLIIYGIVELSPSNGGGGSSTSTSTTTTHSRSSTTSSTTTTTPSTTTETPPPPPPETPQQTPEEAPPPPSNYSPAPTQPPRHHHHFHLPHLPPGF